MMNVRITRKASQHKARLGTITRQTEVMKVPEDRLGTEDRRNDMDTNVLRT
jgi:hypothetical protein